MWEDEGILEEERPGVKWWKKDTQDSTKPDGLQRQRWSAEVENYGSREKLLKSFRRSGNPIITDHRRAQFHPPNLPLRQGDSFSTLAQSWYTLNERAIRIVYFCVSRISS